MKRILLLPMYLASVCISVGQDTDAASLDKESIFKSFAEAYAVVYITPYENRRDSVGIPAEAYSTLERLMATHWRVLLSDIDRLPIHPGRKNSVSTASKISEACEVLPPMEYLDVVDRVLDLTEEGKLPASSGPLEFRLLGINDKNCFIAVNYEHPRVKKILHRSKHIFAADESMSEFLDHCIGGTVAENYNLVRTEDGRVLPETLPGIKRKRQQDTLLKKIERITGKKFPGDPEFDPRPERRGENGVPGTAEVSDSGTSGWLQTLVAGIAAIAAAFGIWKYRKVKTAA